MNSRKVMLRFNISTRIMQLFAFDKSSLKCVVHCFTNVPITKFRLASRSVCEPQLWDCDAYVRILYHFVLMMQAKCLAVWVETKISFIKYIVRFYLFIESRVHTLLLPTMKPVARKLVLICKMFCSMKRAHQGRIVWNGQGISSTNRI
jgi:hypothetical protein